MKRKAMTDVELDRHAETVARCVSDGGSADDLVRWFELWHQGSRRDGLRILTRAAVILSYGPTRRACRESKKGDPDGI